MKTISAFALAITLIGCATPRTPSGLLGTWFDWHRVKEVFVLEADGSGAWRGNAYRQFNWTYNPTARIVTITEFDRSAAELRLLYSSSEGTLIAEDAGLDAEKTTRGEFPTSLFVAVNDVSKIGKSFKAR